MGREGVIRVAAARDEAGALTVEVRDDGVGLEPGKIGGDGLGTRIVGGAGPADPGDHRAHVGRNRDPLPGSLSRPRGFSMAALNILLVEDEALVALENEAQLTGAGHHVVAHVDRLDEALAVTARERVDLALVDINLGEGHSGLDVARELSRRGIVCLFVSGNSAAATPDFAVGVLGKPYDERALLEAVEVAAAVKEGRAPPPPEPPAGMEVFR